MGKDAVGNADCAERGARDPACGDIEARRGHRSEGGHAEHDEGRFRARRDMRPVLTGHFDLGVGVEREACECVQREVVVGFRGRRPDRNTIYDVEGVLANIGEVILGDGICGRLEIERQVLIVFFTDNNVTES